MFIVAKIIEKEDCVIKNFVSEHFHFLMCFDFCCFVCSG